ncbi:MAG: TadE family protein [Terracidiphilus sp.]
MRGRSGNPAGSDSGESLVSFALTAPILFGVVFGLMQACLAFYSHEYISELAREGSRYAIVHGASCETSTGSSCAASTTSTNSTSVATYVKGIALPNIAGGTVGVTTSSPSGESGGDFVTVKVTYTFPDHIFFVSSSSLTMSSSSTMQIIQ